MKTFVGIDNGINGGIAVISDKDIKVIKMPSYKIDGRGKYDMSTIIEFFRDLILQHGKPNIMVGLEFAQPRFKDGSKQAFMTGKGYGFMLGVLETLGLHYKLIKPKEWQYELFQSNKIKDTKAESIKYCQTNFSDVLLLATDRSRTPHDGMADALCIAEYVRVNDEN